jgi:beta-mannosidase
LWWPNATPGVKGGQPLYTVTAECVDGSDRIQTTLGLREIKWVTYPENEPEQWPFTLVVNGHKIFQKGWNWVPADSMGGRLAEQKMKRLVRLAKEAGANFLRCWGGADPETQAFYNTCDQLGILVWQEFPLSSAGISNTPPSDPQYLERLAQYAQAVVAARRNHPSLALWGGGNELTWPDGKPLTLDHPYAATLDKVIKEYDPERTFRPSSPLGPHFDADPEKSPLWDVHGSWEYSERWPGPQYWRVNAISPLLHSELGLPGEASLATQQRHLSPKFRSREASNPARRHLGGAWWEHQVTVDRVFGSIDDPELGVLASQWLQADGLRYYIEETRRRWPKTAGIYPWQLNEPCPNIVCTSAVEYSSQPKLAYYAVKQAYRPVSVTAHYPELKFPGQPLRLRIWALNELAGFEDELVVSFQDLAGRELIAPLRQPASVPANQSTKLLDLEVPMPEGFSGVVVVILTLGPSRNRDVFSNLGTEFLRPALQQPELLRDMFTGE